MCLSPAAKADNSPVSKVSEDDHIREGNQDGVQSDVRVDLPAHGPKGLDESDKAQCGKKPREDGKRQRPEGQSTVPDQDIGRRRGENNGPKRQNEAGRRQEWQNPDAQVNVPETSRSRRGIQIKAKRREVAMAAKQKTARTLSIQMARTESEA